MVKTTDLEKQDSHDNTQGDLFYSLPIFVSRSDIDEQSIMNLWDVTELLPSETNSSEAMDAWMKKAIIGHKKMTVDEDYRKEISKHIF